MALYNPNNNISSNEISPVSKPRVGQVYIVEETKPTIEVVKPTQSSTPSTLDSGNIIFSRNIYSNQEFRQRISTEFEELSTLDNTLNIDSFFTQYNKLFFSIPKTGTNSHTTIITNSTEYVNDYVDPKDQIIEELNQKITELELELAGQGLNENPIFRNGTLIKGPDGNAHYMDQGYRRLVVFTPTFLNSLKVSLYGIPDPELPIVNSTMFATIPVGPPISEQNFSDPFVPNSVSENISNIILELDPEDVNYNPQNYETIEEFESALIKDINEKQAVIDSLTEKITSVNEQINSLIIRDPDYVPSNGNLPATNNR